MSHIFSLKITTATIVSDLFPKRFTTSCCSTNLQVESRIDIKTQTCWNAGIKGTAQLLVVMLSVSQSITLSHLWVHCILTFFPWAQTIIRSHPSLLIYRFPSAGKLIVNLSHGSWDIRSCGTMLLPMNYRFKLDPLSPASSVTSSFFRMFLHVRGPRVKSAAATAAPVAFLRTHAHTRTHARARISGLPQQEERIH